MTQLVATTPQTTEHIMFKTLMRDESGTTAIEYALVAGLMSIAIIASLSLLNTNLSTIFGNISAKLEDAAGR